MEKATNSFTINAIKTLVSVGPGWEAFHHNSIVGADPADSSARLRARSTVQSNDFRGQISIAALVHTIFWHAFFSTVPT